MLIDEKTGDDSGIAEELWLASRCARCLSPEEKLMLALLDDAVNLIAGCKGKNPDVVAEARRWVAADESGWVFSFNNCWTSLFDHDVAKARALILEDPAAIGRRKYSSIGKRDYEQERNRIRT